MSLIFKLRNQKKNGIMKRKKMKTIREDISKWDEKVHKYKTWTRLKTEKETNHN